MLGTFAVGLGAVLVASIILGLGALAVFAALEAITGAGKGPVPAPVHVYARGRRVS